MTETSGATYRVGGMTCGGCVRALTAALERALVGVEITVALEGGLVRIVGAHEAQAVARAVEDAGFDLLDGRD